MTLTTKVGQPVGIILEGGRPARFCWRGERWIVTLATPEDVEFLPVDRTVVTSWQLHAQTESQDDVADLVVRRSTDTGWVIESATFS
jgi:hypothetical protein